MQRTIPIIVCFVFGLFMLIQFFVPHRISVSAYQTVLDWMQIVFVFTLLVGVISYAKLNAKKVTRTQTGWGYNLIGLVGLAVMVILGLWKGTGEKTAFLWTFNNLQAPMQSTMFSLLAFFVASAAYRGFRARSWEAGLLLAIAIVVMLGRVPLGSFISQWIPDAANWILRTPSMAAKRGIYIGIGLGTISTSLRIILGIERTYLGGK
ncbi:hypothetical protein AMJ44_15830 [candidate division WOR-1 bacterium DG_54_3]|jgi:hypothetical protein|uniref:Uncharacterized protein n=1 Tax=candidate division WOR-1 bacterium DG_54_3 TaxID=1703775 RepID=A0A0S7XIR4_UNCSA|nr:MAG: hypothetical protein AMJ44_15830 [candidate division WOR-1 bacterium DG_54_3]